MTGVRSSPFAAAQAAELQDLASDVRDGRSDTMHRVIRATGAGWVEIQAEYLRHLLDRIEDESSRG